MFLFLARDCTSGSSYPNALFHSLPCRPNGGSRLQWPEVPDATRVVPAVLSAIVQRSCVCYQRPSSHWKVGQTSHTHADVVMTSAHDQLRGGPYRPSVVRLAMWL